ncbi:2-oxo acid dehydrogenase subunit E2 [Kitasatospora sp. NPDC059408]|uniref:2-oxo acid dehydrogenase subunit E2 n=1 Tax=Kitasatospora sp. NPDC059408 TaxID=3346823 RepID=UPI0036A7A372
MSGTPFPRERRHTLHFLGGLRGFAPVFLDTEVDMTSVLAHRDLARAEDRNYSLVSYVLWTAARTLARHPQANAAVRGGLNPRVARYPSVSGKLALDKSLGGQRVVLSAVLPELERRSLEEIQRQVEHYRDGDADAMAEFAKVRGLQRLPVAVGRLAYRLAARSLERRPELTGTFAVTSLGHRPVDGFHSVGGTTITLGVGRLADRPVVRDGRLAIAPVMRLSLSFDHRVIDGAQAADILTEIRAGLQEFGRETADRTAAGATAAEA